tara:strand:- start:33 stop:335 length:303 start_codon:yes stop_codon:yes gene_type:complete
MFKKFLRVLKPSEDKRIHLEKLASVINTPHWQEVRDEMEDSLMREYMRIEECKTLEEFIACKANISALKRMAGLNGLVDIVSGRQFRVRPPYGQKTKGVK